MKQYLCIIGFGIRVPTSPVLFSSKSWGIMNCFLAEIKPSVWSHKHVSFTVSLGSGKLNCQRWFEKTKQNVIVDLFWKDYMWKVSCENQSWIVQSCRYVMTFDILICHSQCWTCFGDMKYYRSQSNIVSPEIKFEAFTVVFTSTWLHTPTNTFVRTNGPYRKVCYCIFTCVQCWPVEALVWLITHTQHCEHFVSHHNLDRSWFHICIFIKDTCN